MEWDVWSRVKSVFWSSEVDQECLQGQGGLINSVCNWVKDLIKGVYRSTGMGVNVRRV